MRAGAHALSILGTPLNATTLEVLAPREEPMPLADLRSAVGLPPQTTLRGHLRTLTDAGIVERRRQEGFKGSVECELARPGRELLDVACVLRAWFFAAPDVPIEPGSAAAKRVVTALAEGWSSTVVRALAAKPLALTELARLISSRSYPSLERLLQAMTNSGLVERRQGGRARPYAVTEWLRRAIVPLSAAARWEGAHPQRDSSPIGRLDVESVFLLAMPLLTVREECGGVARLMVDGNTGSERRRAGVVVEVDSGRVRSCVTRLDATVDAGAAGTATEWMTAVLEGEIDRLELHGDVDLAAELVEGMHRALLEPIGVR